LKGIILAGGNGTRLYPITKSISKHLLPIYDKPMIYYPLSILMLAGIRDILIITTPHDIEQYKKLLLDGKQWGINISYTIQKTPDGIAQSFILAEKFIGNDSVALILGDNIFYGHGMTKLLEKSSELNEGAIIFGYHVNDPKRFGVVQFDTHGKVISIEEKPINPKTNYAVTGLYFYDNKVIEISKKIKPSNRGELEITDINKIYLQQNNLTVELLGRGYTWFDSGTHTSLLEASKFIETVEKRQNLKIACIEEIAYTKGYIDQVQLLKLAEPMINNLYGQYLLDLVNRDIEKHHF
jgi:glucose-1-phosphate thymidylyltransferase